MVANTRGRRPCPLAGWPVLDNPPTQPVIAAAISMVVLLALLVFKWAVVGCRSVIARAGGLLPNLERHARCPD